jgi:hypothetical protein
VGETISCHANVTHPIHIDLPGVRPHVVPSDHIALFKGRGWIGLLRNAHMCRKRKVRWGSSKGWQDASLTVSTRQGCYPCSRRRIHCDRTEPSCKKCDSRGLVCTGLGLRVRFALSAAPSQRHPENDVVSERILRSPRPCRTPMQSGPNLDSQVLSSSHSAVVVRGKSPALSRQNDDSSSWTRWKGPILICEDESFIDHRCQQGGYTLLQNPDAIPLWERLMTDYCKHCVPLSSMKIG